MAKMSKDGRGEEQKKFRNVRRRIERSRKSGQN